MASMTVPAAVHRYLLPHENHVVSTRQHPALLIGPGALAFAGLLAAAVLNMTVLQGKTGLTLAVWLAWVLLALRAAWKTVNWMTDFFIVTSDRMMMITGALSRKIAIIPFWTVNDLGYKRSVGGQLFGYGSFLVESGAPEQILQKLDYIPYPEELYLRICEIIFDEQTPCPVCDGAGKVFRHPDQQRVIPAGGSEYTEPDEFRQQRESLLAQGYVEVTCPECGGKGETPDS